MQNDRRTFVELNWGYINKIRKKEKKKRKKMHKMHRNVVSNEWVRRKSKENKK